MRKDKLVVEVDYGYHHLEVGHPDNPKPYRICGSPTTSENAKGRFCLNPAGFKTSHGGRGHCHLHGGNSLSGPDHPNWKHGRYADTFTGRLKQIFELFPPEDDNPLDLLPELNMQRAMLVLAAQQLDAYPRKPQARSIGDVTNVLRNGNVDEVVDSEGLDEMVGGGGIGGFDVDGYPVDIPRPQFSTQLVQDSSIKPPMLLIRSEDYERVMETLRDITTTVTRIIASRNQTALARADIVYLFSTIKQAITLYIPKENQEAFVKFIMDKVPYGELGEKGEESV